MTIENRKYKNYDKYLFHQAKKLDIGIKKKVKKFLPSHFNNDVKSFKKRITGFQQYVKGDGILCLGARLGSEVCAFRELGFENSIGIDLNPGADNKYVVKGDFHKMPFDNCSFDCIYSNCIDHAWNLKKLSKEIHRILKKDGMLILEIDHLVKKTKKDRKELLTKASKYESVMWDDFKDIKKSFKEFKFITKFVGVYDIFLVAIFKKEN